MSRSRRILLGLLSLAIAASLWLPAVHLFFTPRAVAASKTNPGAPLSARAQALAQRHLRLWSDPDLRAEEIDKMRVRNAEWDFMGRTFLVLSLANMSLREPESKSDYLDIMDRIIEETIRMENQEGVYYFLLPYAKSGRFSTDPARSLFIDGEIALMLAARRLVEEKPDYEPLLRERVETMIAYMRKSPVLCGESYPDECWMFCNSIALAAIRLHDVLDGADHSEFIREWLATAKKKLTDPDTGLLISSFTLNGRAMDGPEGSTIWMVVHCLQLVDEDFARDQYERAERQLRRDVLGFGYAREWPEDTPFSAYMDVDSGPIVPVFEASAGSSGMAFVAAAAFDDKDFLRALTTSLDAAAFPIYEDGALKYAASNQVGDAVLLYAHVLGPLWEAAKEKGQR